MLSFLTYAYLWQKISQIQIDGLQPCDDLTWNDPRMKLHGKSRRSTELKINIGIMTKKKNALVVKRGVTLSVTVRTNINY